MELRIALGLINERAVELNDIRLEQASLVVRSAIEGAQNEIQNCHLEISRQRRSLKRIHELASNPNQNSLTEILEEVKETLGLNIPPVF